MSLATNITVFIVVIVVYLAITIVLGLLGWKHTKTAKDYMVAGRRIHPYIMAISYGATFISTSAIVGFGGQAANLGLGLLWLTFLNIFVGIFIAFVFFGKRTRHMGNNLDAHTFPELLGKRFDSRAIQRIAGVVIFVFMPLYAGAVLIGAARFIEETFKKQLNVNVQFVWALIIFTIIIAIYVIAGGMKGVMYTDTLQGSLMLIGMITLFIFAYIKTPGNFIETHQSLTNLASKMPEALLKGGMQGWTTMPILGSPIWWTLVSTIIMGVGIGVLAQPQLAVRFMTVKNNKQLNRGVLIGGIFILLMTGVAFMVGSLSNVYFFNTTGKIAVEVVEKGNVDSIIPAFINAAMPHWFVYLFMLTLLAAAMSTLSSQFHAIGTSFGRDVFSRSQYTADYKEVTTTRGVISTKIGILIGIVLSLVLGYYLPISIIARATAVFFGVCAAAFLPMFILGLFWKRANKAGALAGMITGIVSSLFWMIFIHEPNSKMIGLVELLTAKTSLLGAPWKGIDQIIIAFPLAFIVTLIVTACTKPMPDKITDKAFKAEEVAD
ncbi:MAG: sodium:solute symporter family protein [Actinobacteria bacterium]|nr:sodium:solute symporter family protein [Actinomycetota bacterium]